MHSADYENRAPFAFPNQMKTADGFMMTSAGMTLRDYFAAKALQGLASCPLSEGWSADEFARNAYLLSDAMMKAREAKTEPPAQVTKD